MAFRRSLDLLKKYASSIHPSVFKKYIKAFLGALKFFPLNALLSFTER